MAEDDAGRIRLDKWLWHARFFKTRSLSARMVQDGRVRVNAIRVTKPAQMVGPGDMLTFVQGDRAHVVRIAAIGSRRGPASEAVALYTDLSPNPEDIGGAVRDAGPRPTKKDRRSLDRLRPPLE